jgi:uncharacterized OB-fold protein
MDGTSELPGPAPVPGPETEEYFAAANRGVLLYKFCLGCGKPHFYPRPLCPFCFSDRTEWRQASGRGTIYSCSLLRRAAVPYCIAYVTLEEGPTMLTNIVDCDLEQARIGEAVTLTFKRAENGQAVPMFTPVRIG